MKHHKSFAALVEFVAVFVWPVASFLIVILVFGSLGFRGTAAAVIGFVLWIPFLLFGISQITKFEDWLDDRGRIAKREE